MSQAVYITDVAPRDGLQNESRTIAVEDKVGLVRMLDATGVNEIEVSSFVSPKWVPQLADAAEVFAHLAGSKPVGMVYSALVPNEMGMCAALAVNLAAGLPLIDRVTLFTAASETFSRKNTNATIAETLERFKPVIATARQHNLGVRAYISTVIQCPYEGPIAPAQVADLSARLLLELGVDDVDLGDTIGAATPENTRDMLVATIERIGFENLPRLTLHLHDTFGRAAECVPVALELGLRSFDGSAGGLGGCPYASTPGRGAPGNIATETLVSAIHAAGFQTNVNMAKLEDAARFARFLVAPQICETS